ncbi:MAG: serine hydrolase domain-containing protein [Myxococcota bacterium]
MTAIPFHGHCDPRFDAVRGIFAESFENGTEVGASVCFVLDGETVVDLWGGYLDREKTGEWQRDSLVNVYSTTKGMTALCAHMLIERGALDLDEPVARYWPEFAANGKQDLPVRWLLSHQAGLAAVRKPLSLDDLFGFDAVANALAEQEPWWTPGEKHGYHALTFGHLVGELVRRASGKSVGTFFREEVAEPLEADFHIGLPEALDARTSDLHGELIPRGEGNGGGPKLADIPGPIGEMMRDMADPTTLTGAAFNNPALGRGLVNTRAWRAAEIPAANGHGTASALARIYGTLARGGELDGVRLLEPESIRTACTEQAFGEDAVLRIPIRYGLGFMLTQDFMPFSPNPSAFGHPGAGGSIGMADPDAKLGFGYTMNQMQMGLVGAAGAFAMLKAFYEAL